MHLFLTKVTVKSCIYTQAFVWFKMTVTYSVIYLYLMLNISKHSLGRNGDLLPKICVACWTSLHSASTCNLTLWPTVLAWCLAGSFLQLLLGHYSVRIGYQREQNYTEKNSSQACFSNNTFTFCTIGLLDKSCM